MIDKLTKINIRMNQIKVSFKKANKKINKFIYFKNVGDLNQNKKYIELPINTFSFKTKSRNNNCDNILSHEKKSVENQTYREYVNNTNSFDVNSSNNLYYNSLNSNKNKNIYLGYDISNIMYSCGNLNCSKDDENNKNNLGKLNINQRMTANDIFNNLQMQKRIKNNYEKFKY